MNVPILGGNTPAEDLGPQIRLLICKVCNSIEELPDYVGPVEHDTLLEVAVEKHEFDSGERHLGHLMKVPLKHWARDDVRRQIILQIRGGSAGIDDFEKGFYDTKSTFHEDAMACYKRHLSPKGRCPDWRHDSKKLVPKTAAERKEAGLAPPTKTPVHTYLCDFCPAKIFMVTKAREQAGQYDN